MQKIGLRRGRGHEAGTLEPLPKLAQLDRVGADAGAKRTEPRWALRQKARARPEGAAIHQKDTIIGVFLFGRRSRRPLHLLR